MASYRPVSAVLRALDVLVTINRLEGRATVREIHQQTGIDKATALRMLETLAHAGFVSKDGEEKTFRITGKALQLSSGYDRQKSVGRTVAPILAKFRTSIGWPSDVGIFDYDAMIVAETSREAGPLFFNRNPGYRAPILGTSLGLSYMAFISDEERNGIMQRLAEDPAPWNNLARDQRLGDAMFARIRSQGYAVMASEYSVEEYESNISAIGVPIIKVGKVYAAINVLFLKNVQPLEKVVETILTPLQETAKAMAEGLSESGED